MHQVRDMVFCVAVQRNEAEELVQDCGNPRRRQWRSGGDEKRTEVQVVVQVVHEVELRAVDARRHRARRVVAVEAVEGVAGVCDVRPCRRFGRLQQRQQRPAKPKTKAGAKRTSFQEGNGLSSIGDAPVRFGRSVGTRISFTGR